MPFADPSLTIETFSGKMPNVDDQSPWPGLVCFLLVLGQMEETVQSSSGRVLDFLFSSCFLPAFILSSDILNPRSAAWFARVCRSTEYVVDGSLSIK